jgi:hypothetical protein
VGTRIGTGISIGRRVLGTAERANLGAVTHGHSDLVSEENFRDVARTPGTVILKKEEHPCILLNYCFDPGTLHKSRYFYFIFTLRDFFCYMFLGAFVGRFHGGVRVVVVCCSSRNPISFCKFVFPQRLNVATCRNRPPYPPPFTPG